MITRFGLQVVQEKKRLKNPKGAVSLASGEQARQPIWQKRFWQLINIQANHQSRCQTLAGSKCSFVTAENLNIFGFRQLKTSRWALGRLNADQKGKVSFKVGFSNAVDPLKLWMPHVILAGCHRTCFQNNKSPIISVDKSSQSLFHVLKKKIKKKTRQVHL